MVGGKRRNNFLYVVEHDPTNKFAWNGLGLASLFGPGRQESAGTASLLDPNYAEVYYNKGVSLKYMASRRLGVLLASH